MDQEKMPSRGIGKGLAARGAIFISFIVAL